MGNIQELPSEAQPPTGEFRKFNEKEQTRLKKVFKALKERFPYRTISFLTLYKTFPLPHTLAERLARAIDTSNAEIVDFEPMEQWLDQYCLGSMQTKMEILCRMWGIDHLEPISREELEILLTALMTPVSKFFSLSENSQVPVIGGRASEYIASMLKVIFDDGEITASEDGRIRPEDYLDWQRENVHLVDMLERLLQNTRKKAKKGQAEAEMNDCEGFLFKVGKTFGNWVERWYVLKGKFLYGYKSERDRNYNDILHLENYQITSLDDKAGFFGFRLTPPTNSESKSNTKSLYCKVATDREKWIRALERATGTGSATLTQSSLFPPSDSATPAPETETSGSGTAVRKVASPRASLTNRHLKKHVRHDAEAKYVIMEKIIKRLDETNKRIGRLGSNTNILRKQFGEKEEVDEKNRKIQQLENKIVQLERQLEFKNQFISELQSTFRNQVQQNKEREKRRSMAQIDFFTSKQEEQIQEKEERMYVFQQKAKEQMQLAETDITHYQSVIEQNNANKIECIVAISEEMTRMRAYIWELEQKSKKSWFPF